ncbi:MAG TPA: chromosomal replication initiator protein DnaA [Thermoleophilaceae bacterium]|nr:chromosomal replication initiator protein DnaA [Thermoleophilaceae bacterium]
MPEALEKLWDDVRRELRDDVTDFTFHIWLEPLQLAHRDGATIYVRAPGHIRTWVKERHRGHLQRAAERVLGPAAAVEIVDETWRAAAEPTAAPAPTLDQPTLNPKYTFGQFVIGDGNRLAHAAALAVAELPAHAYNPLFIYGPPGLGKTHLLQAIGNYVQLHGGGLEVRYATVEDFTSDFVRSLRSGDTGAFRDRFRGVDVLLIDDIQFLAAKLKTKEEFFHTFNALYETGRQLVLSSDRAPADHDDFEDRLRERFASGLVADLQPPDLDVRLAILRKRARLDSLDHVSDETLTEIASRVRASVRSLEGALIRVVAYASLKGEAPSPEIARRVLATLYPPADTRRCSLEAIQQAAAEEFGITTEALVAQDRRPAVAFARQVAMYLARELTQESLPAIGARFGGRNHSTVLHAHRKIAADLGRDQEVVHKVDALKRRLQADS